MRLGLAFVPVVAAPSSDESSVPAAGVDAVGAPSVVPSSDPSATVALSATSTKTFNSSHVELHLLYTSNVEFAMTQPATDCCVQL